ncbi:MAG TPA: TlpA disulfide reductase family protein [Bryobacteraceae bacterium]|jgi:peroxiredoxin|nr:TlpA disulfide reductase family protein [Bryobacteraceae bacterium]
MAASRQHRLVTEGSRAPDFRLARLDGGEAPLSELLANGPILLAFFEVTCPICQLTFPFLERLHNPAALAVYGVSQNCPEDTRAFARHFGVSFPMLLDREEDQFPASNAYGISSVPTLFLIERDGTITRVIEGWQRKQIEWLGGLAGVSPIRQGENVPEWKAG